MDVLSVESSRIWPWSCAKQRAKDTVRANSPSKCRTKEGPCRRYKGRRTSPCEIGEARGEAMQSVQWMKASITAGSCDKTSFAERRYITERNKNWEHLGVWIIQRMNWQQANTSQHWFYPKQRKCAKDERFLSCGEIELFRTLSTQ